jgi:hypothetical protein
MKAIVVMDADAETAGGSRCQVPRKKLRYQAPTGALAKPSDRSPPSILPH